MVEKEGFSIDNLSLSIAEAQECLRIANILQGQSIGIQSEKLEIVERVKEAGKFIASQPNMLVFLKHLQSALHQKNIGVFNQLLTYFVQDVLKKEKEISLDLYTFRSLPALKIMAKNGGFPEDIYNGNGGSVANIVSAGLRLIALSRLSHRKFIILDEPDCWLEKDHIPLFAKTIGEISTKLKIQTIIISHHPWSYFQDYARVIKLSADSKVLTTEILLDHDWNIPDGWDYISEIRMQNVMSHTDTVYSLSPYLNCLVGANDIGKSVLSAAMKAVGYNESGDDYISHGQNKANVLISLSGGTQILWERIRNTTIDFPQKVKYSLYKNNVLMESAYDSEEVPQFVSKELNISTVEDIDVHIGNQKEPVFLLGSSVKPQEKAKILSLGKESILIQKMMELLKAKTKTNNAIIREGEAKYDIINRKLVILDGLEEVIQKIEAIRDEMSSQVESVRMKETLQSDIADLISIKEVKSLDVLETDIPLLERKNIEELAKDINEIALFKKISLLEKMAKTIEIPEYKDTKALEQDIKSIMSLGKLRLLKKCDELSNVDVQMNPADELFKEIDQLMEFKKMLEIPKIEVSELTIQDRKDVQTLRNDIEQLSEIKREIQKLKDAAIKGKELEEKIKKDMEDFLKENGGVCKECNQPLSFKHFGVHNG